MAKVVGPLLSVEAHGQFGKSLIYGHRKSGNQVRDFYQPKKEISLKQWTRRHIVGLLTSQWQCKNDNERAVFNDLAKEKNLQMSGFNYFIHLAMDSLLTYHGLCGYWSMNEASGNQVLDYSGNGNHGILKPTYPSNCPVRVPAMIKQYGNALSFDGVNDYVGISPMPTVSDTGKATLSAWIKRNGSQPAYTRIVSKENQNLNQSEFRFVTDFVGTSLAGNVWISNANRGTGNVAFDNNVWNFFTLTYDGTTLKIYKNGVLQTGANLNYSGSISTPAGCDFLIGKISTTYFNGLIDDVRIYNRALSASEILKQYNLLRLNKQR
jgi:hypothetical protein